jgi:hypothetical protein
VSIGTNLQVLHSNERAALIPSQEDLIKAKNGTILIEDNGIKRVFLVI